MVQWKIYFNNENILSTFVEPEKGCNGKREAEIEYVCKVRPLIS
jgi:hypothetical protein